MTTYLPSVSPPEEQAIRICAYDSHALLLLCGKEGLYAYDRRTKRQTLLSWDEIERLRGAVKAKQATSVI